MGVTITVFGRDKCGDCDNVKEELAKTELAYEYKDVRVGDDYELHQAQAAAICEAEGSTPLVPVIQIHSFDPEMGYDSRTTFVQPQGPALEGFAAFLGILAQAEAKRSNEGGATGSSNPEI
jgi:glutaredoxin